jgi:hypothetical protein
MDMTTLNNVKALLVGDTPTDNSQDDILSWLITAVSARADLYCNRGFEKIERVEYHDGGGRYLFLRCPPVSAIASIYGSNTWEWNASALIPASSYQIFTAGMVGYRFGFWPYSVKALKVTYTGGFDPYPEGTPPEGYVPIPSALEQAICSQVVYEYRRRNDLGLRSLTFPNGEIQKVDTGEFLEQVKSVLDRYRVRPGY